MKMRRPPLSMARAIARLLALAATAVTAAAVWTFKDAALERWWLHRLESPDPEVWQAAAQRLAERRCPRAVPGLARRFREQEEDDSKGLVAKILLQLGPPAVVAFFKSLGEDERGEAWGFFWNRDNRTIEVWVSCLDERDRGLRLLALEILNGKDFEWSPVPLPQEALKNVLHCLETDSELKIRFLAARLLTPNNPELKPVRTAIFEALKSNDADLKRLAASREDFFTAIVEIL
ncbi:MAG: hypothetical protein HY717_23800 [Planctomycetes bacterium]|nr:hypothetical protein [Planctomycetota bacterium]